MLISKELLEKAIVNFPKWMDIRKRYFSSNGGKLLSTVADTVEDIQKEINAFIKEFFITYYENNCDIIPDFLYRTYIGIMDMEAIKIINPLYEITNDIQTFYDNKDYAYYKEGYIFIKNDLPKIKYSYKNKEFTSETEKYHVWNVYDEFALFINIERYQNETNKELYRRIIDTANGVINSSNKGLKKSILSSLVNIIPELEEDNITLERPTATNLVKYYNKNKTILEELSTINHDVLKDKVWDKDMWQYTFKEIDYLPNEWDMMLNYYANGIGDNDDLKVEIIDVNKPTDATITFYSKSEDKISEYVKSSNIDYNLVLKAKKYNNILNELKAEYKITASEVIELSSSDMENINFDLYKNITGKHIRNIDDLIISQNGSKDIYKIRQGELQEGYKYKLKFVPKIYNEPMTISNIYVEKSDGAIIDYMLPANNFILKNGILYNNKVKAYANKKSDFISTVNIIDTANGMAINNISNYAELEYDLTGLNNNAISVSKTCNLVDIYSEDIKCNNFYYDTINKSYKSDSVDSDKTLEINIEANKFYMEVGQGQCNITVIIDNEVVYNGLPFTKDNKSYYETNEYNSPKKMQIIIAVISMSTVIISKLQFSKYVFEMKLSKGEFVKSNNKLYLPNIYNNVLKINFKTFTQNSVILNNLFIGEQLDENDEYITELIEAEQGDTLIIDSTCKVELYKSKDYFEICSRNNKKIEFIDNYKTNNVYVASSNDAYLILNTSEYNEINNIYIENGTYESIGNNEYSKCIIYLKLGEKLSEITIEGSYNKLTKEISLKELIDSKILNFDPYNELNPDKIFINRITKSFILKRNNEENIFDIFYTDFVDNASNINIIEITNLPDNIEAAFVIDNETKNIVINNKCDNMFYALYLYPKYSQNFMKYIAKNEYSSCLENVEDVEIINTFNNGYKENTLMIYTVEPLTEGFLINFSNGKNWSIGKKKLNIKFNINYKNNDTFNFTQKIISKNILLQDIVHLNNYYITDNKENIELAQYMIVDNPDEYKVIYNYDENDISYEKAEYIDIYDNSKFNKLKYSNIYTIKYLGPLITSESEELEPIDGTKYTVIKDKGIIIWNDISITKKYSKLYVIYTIKKPVALQFNIDLLYKKINYNINAYKKITSYELKDIYDNYVFNINSPVVNYIKGDNKKNELDTIATSLLENSYIVVTCTNPNFKAEKYKNYIVFNKIKEDKAIAVKNGWYYFNDKEYFMFAADCKKEINIDSFTELTEINKYNGMLHFHKKTSNFINNSKMTINSFSETYKVNDFNNIKALKGISSANELTACESYNNWVVSGVDLSLKTGVNGLGIYFKSLNDFASYAYLELTEYLYDISYISFASDDNLKCYIGINKTNNIVNDNIDIINTLESIENTIDDYKYCKIKKNKKYKYYLVVIGTGLLDDLIISNEYKSNCHIKNINMLGYSIAERLIPTSTKRVFIKNTKGNKYNNTEVNSENFIINSSEVDWNLTKIYKFNTKQQWLNNTLLKNINIETINSISHVLYTTNNYGNVTTKPIFIENYNTVNKIYYKINTLPLSRMKNIITKFYAGKKADDISLKIDTEYKNTSSFNCVSNINFPYFKLSIDVPPNKYIDNIEIFIEYKSNDLNYPVEIDYTNGSHISSILDTFEENNYKLKNLDIDKQSNNFNLFIRAAKEGSNNEVWTSWKRIILDDDFKVKNNIEFENYRFFQLKAELLNKNAKVKINYIDLEVI